MSYQRWGRYCAWFGERLGTDDHFCLIRVEFGEVSLNPCFNLNQAIVQSRVIVVLDLAEI